MAEAEPRVKRARPHPYALEASTPAELRMDPRQVTAVVLGAAAFLLVAGLWLQLRFGYISPDVAQHGSWEMWTRVPLFSGLALLGIGLLPDRPAVAPTLKWTGVAAFAVGVLQIAVPRVPGLPATWDLASHWTVALLLSGSILFGAAERTDRRHIVSVAGWVLFGTYWALTARDLLVREGQDYVNFVFAMAGVFLTLWIAYHVWLDKVRGTRDDAVRFLQVAVFVAAGFYFLIDKVQYFREKLIASVAAQTKWGLDLFGQGDQKGLVFTTHYADSKAPTRFYYPDTFLTCPDGTPVPPNLTDAQFEAFSDACPTGAGNWFEELLFTAPGSEGLAIVPVNIILACTALQSIMLFVGLFAGIRTDWRKIVKWSLIVGALVYVLNLIRNVGIIWFYGQGHASFWMMHNAIGKGGSLVAILLIAVALFRYFPEFFRALVGVLDLIDRDGPVERTLRIGRRRPDPASAAAVDPGADVLPGT